MAARRLADEIGMDRCAKGNNGAVPYRSGIRRVLQP
jgi:hypothetical protein